MINVALIGFGYWGPNVARNIHLNKGLKLHSVCDTKDIKLKRAESIYGKQVGYELDYKKTINNDDIHAIAIATETSSHFDLVKEALLSGKHVYVEKPFTSTVKEAKVLKDLALKLNLIIHIDHIMIFHPVIKKIKTLIEDEEIGDILYIDSARLNLGQIKKDVTSMLDLAVHDLSIIDYFSKGSIPHSINAFGEKYYNPKQSVCYLNLKYDNFMVHIQSNWISPLKERKLIIVGSKKMIVYDDVKSSEKLTVYDKNVEQIQGSNVCDENYSVKTNEAGSYCPYIPKEDALFNSLDHFRNCIKENKNSISGPDQSIRVLSILEIASNSMNS